MQIYFKEDSQRSSYRARKGAVDPESRAIFHKYTNHVAFLSFPDSRTPGTYTEKCNLNVVSYF